MVKIKEVKKLPKHYLAMNYYAWKELFPNKSYPYSKTTIMIKENRTEQQKKRDIQHEKIEIYHMKKGLKYKEAHSIAKGFERTSKKKESKIGKKAKTYRLLKWYIKANFSANIIQRNLTKRGLGIRRKELLNEIRRIKKLEKKKEIEKYIPKKYRKPLVVPPIKKLKEIYRASFIIQNVPIHSKLFKRNYLGFRLLAFSFDKEQLYGNYNYFKKLLVKLTNEYLHGDILSWEGYDFYIGTENPVLISVYNPSYLNGSWIFRVEKEGSEQYSKTGRF